MRGDRKPAPAALALVGMGIDALSLTPRRSPRRARSPCDMPGFAARSMACSARRGGRDQAALKNLIPLGRRVTRRPRLHLTKASLVEGARTLQRMDPALA